MNKDYKNRYILPITMAERKKTLVTNIIYGTFLFGMIYYCLYTIGGYSV